MAMSENEKMTRVLEAYGSHRFGEYVSLTEISRKSGLDAGELKETLEHMRDVMDGVSLEPEPFNHRVGDGDVRVWWGGEWMDKLIIY